MTRLTCIPRRSWQSAPSHRALGFGGLLLILLLAVLIPHGRAPSPVPPESVAQAQMQKLPLYFIENQGQGDARVAYHIQGRDTSAYFTAEGLTLSLQDPPPRREAERAERLRQPVPTPAEVARKRWAVQIRFVGAAPVRPHGGVKAKATVSYFKGPPQAWMTALPTYTDIVYPQVWPGIDVAYSGDGGHIKATFQVRPGTDPRQIQLAYQGADSVALTEAGRLAVHTPVGGFEEDLPLVYQEIDGRRVAVEARYTLAQAEAGVWRYGFALGAYDTGRPLIIDPTTLLYAGYVGGSNEDSGQGIAVDGLGQAYVTGYTASTQIGNPPPAGPDFTHNGDYDAFVVKVSADGSQLVYAGYIGGSGYDSGNGIAVDSLGQAYVVGTTRSTDASFPVRVGPDLSFNGYSDAFVAKISADGSQLAYAGYIGGSSDDFGMGIAVDGLGQAYVTGTTNSTEASFPVGVGPDLTFNGYDDAFVAKLSADGSQLAYAGYIGGISHDAGNGIAVDSLGQAYVAGTTNSTEASFPVGVGPDLSFNGNSDAFVAKLSADGAQLAYAGYIGGSSDDAGNGIAVDGLGQAYVTGTTKSTEASFPVGVGPDLTFNGYDDAFVAKLSADGSQLAYAGYIGGISHDAGNGIAVDSLGQAYVAGTTNSTEASFPVGGGPDLSFNGNSDAFVAKVNADGSQLAYAGYIGGSGDDAGNGIAVDGLRQAYVAGTTNSTEASFPVGVGPGLAFNGYRDVFVAKLSSGEAKPTVECLFDWAEGRYASLFAPPGAPTAVWSVYVYRYYSATNAYLGVSSVNNHVYYLGPDGNLQDEGPISFWLPLAGCQ